MGRPKSAEEQAVIQRQLEKGLKDEALKKTHIRAIGDVPCTHVRKDKPITPCDLHEDEGPKLVETLPTCPTCKRVYDERKAAWDRLPSAKNPNARPTTMKEAGRRGGKRLR